MESETNYKILTVCDKCCELLNHKALSTRKTMEIRVEPCPKCAKENRPDAKKIIEGLLDSPDLNLDNLEEETKKSIEMAREWLERNKPRKCPECGTEMLQKEISGYGITHSCPRCFYLDV